ncbi:MAG: ubiquinol-cytochrome C chaperone [Sphingomonadaceae bacterium]|nr:ubiquinol-cytochrome C chaperone [Sphingomonadaceae bacterium]
MSILSRLSRIFTPRPLARDVMRPLYDALVVRARAPIWYHGGVPDHIDGRFEMVTALLSLTLLRLEDAADLAQKSVWLTEIFVDDMDAQLRQIGIGDMVVGKHIGRMMAALGGRLGAYRDAAGAAGARAEKMADVLARNLGDAIAPAAASAAGVRLAHFADALAACDSAAILAGDLPDIAA